jgi:hypothetical protein
MSRYCLAAPRVRTLTGPSAARTTASSTNYNEEHIESTVMGPEGLSALSAKDLTRATIRRAGLLLVKERLKGRPKEILTSNVSTRQDGLVPLPTNDWSGCCKSSIAGGASRRVPTFRCSSRFGALVTRIRWASQGTKSSRGCWKNGGARAKGATSLFMKQAASPSYVPTRAAGYESHLQVIGVNQPAE